MIDEAELRRIARRDGTDPMLVDLDYALACFLASLFRRAEAAALCFKGGTCLRKCYYADYRYSEDLDFTLTERMSREALEDLLTAAARDAADDWAVDFGAGPLRVEVVDDEYGKETYGPGTLPLGLPSLRALALGTRRRYNQPNGRFLLRCTMTGKGERTRERILARAIDLMVRQGFGATSIRDLLEAAGVTKGTLYFHFQGKDDLGIAVLERARDQFLAFVRKSLAGKTPRKRLESHFRAALQAHQAAGYIGGCLWGNTALEMSDAVGGERYLETVSQVFAAWTAMVKQVIAEGQRLGEIRSDVRAGDLATHVVAAIEGGVMLSRLRKDPASLKGTLTSLRQMLGPKPAATRPGAGGRRLEGAGR